MTKGLLAGRCALVTGASRGIGRAIATEFAAQGASVVVNYVDQESEAQATVEDIRAAGGRAMAFLADVTDRAAVGAMFERAQAEFGPLYALVNNAGITRDRTLSKMDDADWDQVLAVNLTGIYNCTRHAVAQMREGGGGRIVSISSIVATAGAFGQTNYGATKAGVLGFTRSASLELARYGITVNAVCPGYIDTQMLAAVPEKVRESVLEKIPLGRFGDPGEVAAVVRFLATEGSYVTGQGIHVNGGLYA